MGKIVMSGPQIVSLDGVVQDPDGNQASPPPTSLTTSACRSTTCAPT
ncbi:hypothetical protein ABZZ47_36685 [Streptomyces sp. NPDC006465]